GAPLGLPKDELYDALAQKAGQPLSEDQVLSGVYNLQKLYDERGYLEAKVRVQVATDPATRRATVTYQVESGPQAKVDRIDFAGSIAPFPQEDREKQLQVKRGAGFTKSAAEGSAERLQRWLVSQRYNLARVQPPRVERPGVEQVRLTYPVELG